MHPQSPRRWLQTGARRRDPCFFPRDGSSNRIGSSGRTLTPREIEIVRLVCEGLGNIQIAKRLRIGEATVKTHVHRIYEKLRLRDRLQLSLYGREKGLR
jgi:DNA-binding NarL/FixJ family response regulator